MIRHRTFYHYFQFGEQEKPGNTKKRSPTPTKAKDCNKSCRGVGLRRTSLREDEEINVFAVYVGDDDEEMDKDEEEVYPAQAKAPTEGSPQDEEVRIFS